MTRHQTVVSACCFLLLALAGAAQSALQPSSSSLSSPEAALQRTSLRGRSLSSGNVFDHDHSVTFLSAFLVTVQAVPANVSEAMLADLEDDVVQIYNTMDGTTSIFFTHNEFSLTAASMVSSAAASVSSSATADAALEYSYIVEVYGQYDSPWCQYIIGTDDNDEGPEDFLQAPSLFGSMDQDPFFATFLFSDICKISIFTEADFLAAMQQATDARQSELSIQAITQVTYHSQCIASDADVDVAETDSNSTSTNSSATNTLSSRLRIVVDVNDTDAQLAIGESIAANVVAAYNEINQRNPHLCDPYQHEIFSVELDEAASFGDRRLQTQPCLDLSSFRASAYVFNVVGTCRSCATYTGNSNDISSGRGRQLFSSFFFFSAFAPSWWSFEGDLDFDSTCFCDVNSDGTVDGLNVTDGNNSTIRKGPPTVDDILDVLQSMEGDLASIVSIIEEVPVPCAAEENITIYNTTLDLLPEMISGDDDAAISASDIEICIPLVYDALQALLTCDPEHHQVASATFVLPDDNATDISFFIEASCDGCDPADGVFFTAPVDEDDDDRRRRLSSTKTATSAWQHRGRSLDATAEEECYCNIDAISANRAPTMDDFMLTLQDCLVATRR
mmetsp:Transcript_27171/g.76404  ORF Transcript_27171/g.76404 Transcript_27171/m.76404 type:complete len:618 (+) Transcript_27171:275-2128(+)|eukprot:CAMPEP_0119558154 /NCGR_PEP_ID=MMETSP1352-20130426/10215_1 /TAXON_ID=265584 /ORGANISM="Stauroneis constricta, Strain CCMP1120" /LENGTH=617 /DNA_ID=CAMNT_0007605419 /DNA_START=222 /DNA_END=2075 /DNA_ORIENTATION=+